MKTIIKLIAKRVALGLLTVIIISLLIFAGVEALPGDLAESILGQAVTEETVAAFRKEMRLDLPAHIRYLSWFRDMMHGDLGRSIATRTPVIELIDWRFKNTIFLAAVSAAMAIPLSLFLGILAALYRNSWLDRTISMVTLTFISFPEFFIAYILIALFSVKFILFPSLSEINADMTLIQKLHNIMLPCLTMTLVVTAHMMRQTRAAIINILSSPYIEMARLKGLSQFRIILVHAFPNALSPVINVVALNLAYLIVGVVIVEVVFVYPGLGQLLVDSVSQRDIPVVQASGLIFAVTYIALNLIADILSIISNPRLREPR
jgi:peptide/nickel transport system permease protein